jgi:hypothetical protein
VGDRLAVDGGDPLVTPQSRVPETNVPDGETPAATCPHCDRPFRTRHLNHLHVGEKHPEAATEGEGSAHEAALETERDQLFTYQLRVVITLGVTYAMMVIVLMVLLSGNV